jgi:Protein of unknown function (DUF2961)
LLFRVFTFSVVLCAPAFAQTEMISGDLLSGLITPHEYTQRRSSSYDRSGRNGDSRPIAPGETLTLLDDSGPGIVTHLWFTIATDENYHLKKLVLRAYWDGEATPSVETPVGDFFGLGLGQYVLYQSLPLQVAPDNALNAFFPMPFQKSAKITVTNEGSRKVDDFYFNIDYRAYKHPLPSGTLYFHAQYRQATPNRGWTNNWEHNSDPLLDTKKT